MLRDGDVLYPAPWARDASTSFLLSERDTRMALGLPSSRLNRNLARNIRENRLGVLSAVLKPSAARGLLREAWLFRKLEF